MYVPGVLPLLTSVLQSGVDDERKAAADTLAELAKDPENVKVFKVRTRTVVFSPCNPFDDHCWTYIYINLIFYFYCVLNVERQNAEGHLGRDGEIGIQPETSSHCC